MDPQTPPPVPPAQSQPIPNVPTQPGATPPPTSPPSPNSSNDQTIATIITIVLLLFIFPFGLIMMWLATKWPKWLKWLLTIIFILLILLGSLPFVILLAIDPAEHLERARKESMTETPQASPSAELSPTQIVIPSPTITKAPTKIPSPIPTKAIAPPPTSSVQSSGTKTMENGQSALILSGSKGASDIKITIQFSNTSSETQSLSIGRVIMKSTTHGTSNRDNYFTINLAPSEKKTMTLSYDDIPNPPYTFVYTTMSGEAVELGKYTP